MFLETAFYGGLTAFLVFAFFTGITMLVAGGPIIIWTTKGARKVEEDLATKLLLGEIKLENAYNNYRARVGALWFSINRGYIDRLYDAASAAGKEKHRQAMAKING